MRATIQSYLAVVGALSSLLVVACNSKPEAPAGPTVGIEIAPLELAGIDDAQYEITVRNKGGGLVWQRSVTSSQFGDSKGAIAYVGPCDASPGANPNRVQLVVQSLSANGSPVSPADYQNPAPTGTPLEQPINCEENADVSVTFNLTILRRANQGFFDIAVNFEDVFCSAKLDCVDEFLHDPVSKARGTTAIVGFACTSGQAVGGVVPPTYLYLSDTHIICEVDGTETTYAFNPGRGPGQVGGSPPYVYEAATYRGKEALPGFEKCYWNQAYGLDLAALQADGAACRVELTGTASGEALDGGVSPTNTIWPVIHWSVQLTDGDGAQTCGSHPLNVTGSGVTTGYTGFSGQAFAHSLACGSGEVSTHGSIACAGTPHIAGASGDLAFAQSGDTVTVTYGALAASAAYKLPADTQLGGCCSDPCCDQSN